MPQRPLALITGASAGIGAEFARQLAAAGHDLALVARRRERLENLGRELAAGHGIDYTVIEADLAEPGAPAAAYEAATTGGRSVDVLINNAGYAIAGHYHATAWEDQARFLRIMVDVVCELSHRALPGMRSAGAGRIVNVASLAGIVPGSAGHTLYAASKAFLIKFSESLAMESQNSGIRVQALCPGFTYSEFHDVVGTRDIVSRLPRWMWMDAEAVVAFSLDQLAAPRAPVMAVPGRTNRLIAMLSRKLPYRTSFDLVARRSGDFRRQE
ncbi:MAG: SDR family oxidoreductase [Wenzhouxiangella sp.]|nr:MAG: SDR family oxidoreductase [Wenzhouxiangella sp.]